MEDYIFASLNRSTTNDQHESMSDRITAIARAVAIISDRLAEEGKLDLREITKISGRFGDELSWSARRT